ncbi:MAG: hypothetical protein D6780_02510 [Candidatus Dadabacteria bacterium]|nr:MAG: hypothetical protein D6780_02510 [Candidatus Dadabacteria bacterium]
MWQGFFKGVLLSFLILLLSCTPREQGVATGAVAGGAAGALVGQGFKKPGTGAAIGAGAGAVVGGLAGDYEQGSFEEQKAIQRQIIKHQEEEIKRQRREIEDLKRQQYYNEKLHKYLLEHQKEEE